jgi:hypothetical protein
MCVFVGSDTMKREGLADRFPMRKIRPLRCLAGRFYLHFELSRSYARDSSQELRESPAISVLIVCKIQHTQIGSVLVVLSVTFHLFHGGWSISFPNAEFETLATFLSFLDFSTWMKMLRGKLYRQSFKVMQQCCIVSCLIHPCA